MRAAPPVMIPGRAGGRGQRAGIDDETVSPTTQQSIVLKGPQMANIEGVCAKTAPARTARPVEERG